MFVFRQPKLEIRAWPDELRRHYRSFVLTEQYGTRQTHANRMTFIWLLQHALVCGNFLIVLCALVAQWPDAYLAIV